MVILRREWFGGMYVEPARPRMELLDADDYARKRKELERQRAEGAQVRIVDVTEHGYPLREDTLSSPSNGYIDVTRRCNAACTHCYAHGPANAQADEAPGGGTSLDEMSLAEIVRIVDELAKWGADYVRLTGGEPTVRDDLFAIIDAIHAQGLRTGLNTNGLFGEQTLSALLDRGVKDIRISLDGPESINDHIRGTGSYSRAMSTLRAIAQYNETAESKVDTTVNTVLMRSTRSGIRHMIEVSRDLGFVLSLGLLRPMGRAQRDEMLAPTEVAACAREVNGLRKEFGLHRRQVRVNFDVFCDGADVPNDKPFPFDNSKCPLGALGLGIAAGGRIVPCNYLGTVDSGRWLGEDVRRKDILELWHHSTILNEARKVRRQACSTCAHYRSRCDGGCPATAYVANGDADGADPYCVRHVVEEGAK